MRRWIHLQLHWGSKTYSIDWTLLAGKYDWWKRQIIIGLCDENNYGLLDGWRTTNHQEYAVYIQSACTEQHTERSVWLGAGTTSLLSREAIGAYRHPINQPLRCCLLAGPEWPNSLVHCVLANECSVQIWAICIDFINPICRSTRTTNCGCCFANAKRFSFCSPSPSYNHVNTATACSRNNHQKHPG